MGPPRPTPCSGDCKACVTPLCPTDTTSESRAAPAPASAGSETWERDGAPSLHPATSDGWCSNTPLRERHRSCCNIKLPKRPNDQTQKLTPLEGKVKVKSYVSEVSLLLCISDQESANYDLGAKSGSCLSLEPKAKNGILLLNS